MTPLLAVENFARPRTSRAVKGPSARTPVPLGLTPFYADAGEAVATHAGPGAAQAFHAGAEGAQACHAGAVAACAFHGAAPSGVLPMDGGVTCVARGVEGAVSGLSLLGGEHATGDRPGRRSGQAP